MIKMIIADDEQIVRNGLKKVLPWEEMDIEIIAEASNGQEALELCIQLQPDILFTDIRMPLMDGLEVALKLKELEIDVKIIILSGAQDFNYLKTALSINAEGYILKPIKIIELKEVIKKVIRNIYMERNKQLKMQQLLKQLQESMVIMREKFLQNLIRGVYQDENAIRDKLDYFQIPLEPEESLLVVVVQIDDYNKVIEHYTEEDKQLLSFTVNNTMDEIVRNYNCGFSSLINENEFIIIFNQKFQNNKKYIDICEEISAYLNRFLDLSVSIGIGHSINRILQLNESYKSANMVLRYRFYSGKGSILSISDINNLTDRDKNQKINEFSNLNEAENNLVKHMQLGDETEVTNIIKEIFDYFCSNEKVSVDYIHYFCVEIISIASRSICELGYNLDTIIDKRSEILEKIYKMENVFDLKQYMMTLFREIAIHFLKKHKQKNLKVVDRIKKIIEQQYMDDIDVKTISNEAYFSPNYISFMFKNETGETIIEYLTKVRMETAKVLLKTTDLKISEISEKVGYDSQFYFSNVFKKYVGINPGKYRDCTNVENGSNNTD